MYVLCIGVAKSVKVGMNFSTNFKNPLFCKGSEKHIADCIVHGHVVNDNLCNNTMATCLMCQTGISHQNFSMLHVLHVNVDRSSTAHTQSCQQWFSRGKLDPACLCPPTTVQGQ